MNAAKLQVTLSKSAPVFAPSSIYPDAAMSALVLNTAIALPAHVHTQEQIRAAETRAADLQTELADLAVYAPLAN